MTWLISDEARKHRAFREVWVAYLLGGLYLLLGLYTEISEQNYSALYDAQQKWWFVQQNIRSYGATLTAFLLAVGLPRLVCCEKEYRTDDLVGTAALGRRLILQTVTYKCCKEEKSNGSDENDRRAAEPCMIPTIRLGKPAGNEN